MGGHSFWRLSEGGDENHIGEFGKTSILGFSEVAYDIVREETGAYSSKYSKKEFTL